MKKLRVVIYIFVLAVLMSCNLLAQSSVPSYTLEITNSKTTHLIFPSKIKSVDLGSREVLAQSVVGVENVLQVKAGSVAMKPTNITVFTVDGRIYPFEVQYKADPETINYSFSIEKPLRLVRPSGDATMDSICETALEQRHFLHRSAVQQEIKCSLTGIYLDRSLLWFTFKITNRSLIGFKPEYVKFLVVDRKRARRTALQELELTPVYRQVSDCIAGNASESFALAFESFAIPPTKKLFIIVGEKSGDRILRLKVSPSAVLHARFFK